MFRWLLSLAAVATASIVDCGPGLFPVDLLAFSPDPPTAGENVTLTILYTVPQDVVLSEGTVHYSYTLNGLPYSPVENDLCEDIECPLVGGLYNKTTVTEWPNIAGKFIMIMRWLSETDGLLLCTKVSTRTMESSVSKNYNITKHFLHKHRNETV